VQSKLRRAFAEKFSKLMKAKKNIIPKPKLEFKDDQKVIQM
jgi:hypothetical protein